MWHRLFDTYWKLSDSIDKLREEVWDADDSFHRDVNRIANELEIIRLEEIRVPDTIHPEEKRNNWGSRISSLIEKLEPYIKPYITKIDDAVGQLQRQISQVVQKAGGVVDDTFRLEPIAGETIETLGKEVVQESGEAAGREILHEELHQR